jgi:hypothetical protein
MFEMTFTGRWGIYARIILEEVNLGFAVILLPYVVLVNFAVMKVISALFLKQTLDVAAQDEANKLADKQREHVRIAKEIGGFFEVADSSGDGSVSLVEFEEMLKHPNIAQHFSDLDLQADEADALFGVLAASDGEADFHEFVGSRQPTKGLAQKGVAMIFEIWIVIRH